MEETERRNPYILLGIPFGASKEEARRAAARRTRELRRATDAMYSMEDLTWALHQVEHVIEDPEAGVGIFRVPATPGILNAPSGQGLFHPPVRPMPRQSPPLSDEEFSSLRLNAVREVTEDILFRLGPTIDCRPPDPVERSNA
jgi:hypothetical protein